MTTNAPTRKLSAVALAVVGAIHLLLAPEYLDQQAYLGVLFIAGGIALLGLALRLWWSDDARAWTLGALIMAGMGVGFVLSRTTGLPGFKEAEWELTGIVCLVLEAGFVAVAAARALSATPQTSRPSRAAGGRREFAR